MKNNKLLALLALPLTAGSLHAATINWTVSTITNTAADVSNIGTGIIAASGSDGGTNANLVDGVVVATVNGVDFTDDFTQDSPSHLDTINTRANASGQYYEMLRYADRLSSGIAKWSFSGLSIGNTYQFQVWYSDDVSTAGNNGLVLGGSTFLNSGSTVTPVFGDSGSALLLQEIGPDTPATSYGQFATGSFIADATTQTLIGRSYTNLLTTPATTGNVTINAYQLRDLGVVPEPSAALLGALGSLLLLRRRRC